MHPRILSRVVLPYPGGAVTSGMVYLVTIGDREPARTVWRASTGGDYVVTPSKLTGDEQLRFFGP